MMILLAKGDPRVSAAFLGLAVFGALLYWWINTMAFGKGKVRERGIVVRGWWVQANDNLFEDGTFNWPALVVYSFEDRPDKDEILSRTVQEFARLKTATPQTPLEQHMAIQVVDETYHEGFRLMLPLEFTEGMQVYLAHVKVKRGLLRSGKITQPYALFKALPDIGISETMMIESD